MIWPSELTRTAPTRGLGDASAILRRASSSARLMKFSSEKTLLIIHCQVQRPRLHRCVALVCFQLLSVPQHQGSGGGPFPRSLRKTARSCSNNLRLLATVIYV